MQKYGGGGGGDMRWTSIPSSCEETITKSLQLTSKPILLRMKCFVFRLIILLVTIRENVNFIVSMTTDQRPTNLAWLPLFHQVDLSVNFRSSRYHNPF